MPEGAGGSSAGLLSCAPGLRLLFGATLASALGTWLAYVALVIDVYDRTGSAAWVSALLFAEFAPMIVIGLLAGPLLDRLPRRRVLIAADLIRAAAFCLVPFAGNSLQIILIAMIAGAATSAFRPAVYAGLPNLVSDGDLVRANGLLQAADNATIAVGPVLGGLLVVWVGPAPSYWLNAASFALSALLIWRIRESLETGEAKSRGHWRDLADGLRLLGTSRGLLTVVVVWSAVMLGTGAISVSEVVLAKRVFGAGDAGYGLMLTAVGVGLVIGSLQAGRLIHARGVRLLYAAGIGVMAAATAAAALSPGVATASIALAFGGLGNGVALVGNAILVQRDVPDQARGRAFTLAMSTNYVALGIGMIVAGPVTDALGARATWGIAAGVIGGAAVTAAVMTRGVAASLSSRQRAV